MFLTKYSFTNHTYFIHMYTQDLAFNNQDRLICRKTPPINQLTNQTILIIILCKQLYFEITVKFVTVFEDNQYALSSIANTLRFREALLLSLDCSTLPLVHAFYCWVLSKEIWSINFKVFGMTRPGIEPKSPGPLLNILPTRPMSLFSLK